MSRWKAGAIHLAISLVIFLSLFAAILLFWYPGALFTIDGGWEGLRIVMAVDIVAGPLLTLIIFKSGKPGLKFDLSCIAIFQASCILAGMWVVYNDRPLAIVLAYDTIYSVDAKEFRQYELDPQILRGFPGSYPKLIYVELPGSGIAAEIASIRAQFIGDPLYIQTDKYQPMPEQIDELREVFMGEQSTRAGTSEAVLSQIDESCLLSKFVSAVGSGLVCFDAQSRSLSNFLESEAVE